MFSINRPPAPSNLSGRENNSDPIIDRLQNKQKIFEKGVERFPACDTKAQEVLKLIQADHGLWTEIHDKLEVRVIKTMGEEDIILHNKDEPCARWSGKYHVYITVQHENNRLIIDPYIGGENSCAHIDEKDFIEANWKGVEGKEYKLETVAPTDEEDIDGNYTPAFSLKDYMHNLFDPNTYASHKFYYG